jgi:hypothetical protein
MIIYPPLIADTIPAFTTEEIKIPFTWNPAVNKTGNKSYCLILKNYFDSKTIATLET